MNVSPRDQIGLQQKHENQRNQQSEKRSKSSRPWSSFRNPRIVHPSRFSGAKDRHSKVCTIRGLRDRRIRLSVATALQLYNLQERLNLTQPSKVIDWLLEETKQEIDNLPPLHFPPILPSNSASHHELNAYPSSYHSSFDLNQTHTNQDCAKRSNLEQEKVDKNKNHGCTILNQDGGVNSTNFTIPIFPNNAINPANPYFNWEFFPFMRHGAASQADQATYSGQPVFTPNNSSIFGPRLENESRKYKQFLNPQMLSNNLVTTSFSSMNPLSSMFNLHPQRQETSNGSTSSDS